MYVACFPAAVFFAGKHTVYFKVRSSTGFVLLASVEGSFSFHLSLFHLMCLLIDSPVLFLKGEI